MFTLRAHPIPALLAIIVVLLGAVLLLSVKAFASSPQNPSFTTAPTVTAARFAIPPASHATWTLRLWSHGQLVGSEEGTSGTLSVPLPAVPSCTVQADVRTTRPDGRFRYYSGLRTHAACCPALPSADNGITSTVSAS
jgi:hypothetical protein